jgi:capsular polysaccharide biosynthesis protein
MSDRRLARAALRSVAPRAIGDDELLWTDRAGFSAVFADERIDRSAELKIEAGAKTGEIHDLRRAFADPGYTSGMVAFARLADILVDTSLGVSATPDGTVIDETAFVAQLIDPDLGTIHRAIDDRRQDASFPKVSVPVLHCFHRSTPAYGHFVFDCLSVIVWFRDVLLSERIRLLLPAYFPSWGLDILARLGLDPDRHIVSPEEEVVLCRDIVIPNVIDTSNTHFPNRQLCQGLRHALLQVAETAPAHEKSRFVYLSRLNQTNYSNRSIDNEMAVQFLLRRMGFAILEPANMDFAAQIAAFRDAAVIVGGHGSGFGNLIAANAGTTIVDLMPRSWIGYWGDIGAERWVLHMTTLFNQNYVPIVCGSTLIDPAEVNAAAARHRRGMHYEVDLDLLEHVVGAARDLDYQRSNGDGSPRAWVRPRNIS